MPALAEHFRVIRFDLDGHGRSPLTGPVSVRSLARDLSALIATLGGSAHVIGHSLGTLVSTEPARARSLVLLGPVRAQPDAAKEATRARAATVREKGMTAVADIITQNATAGAARAANPLVAGVLRELLLGQRAEGYAQMCEARAAAENPDLAKVTADVLLLTGNDDKVSTEAIREAMKSSLAKVTSETVNDCGHWTVTEAPAFVAAHTLAFLRKLEGGSTN